MPERIIEIRAFEGVDTFSNWNVGKSSRLAFAENARAVQGGSIEKRDGSVRYGDINLNTGDVIRANLGLFRHRNTTFDQGIYRFITYDPAGARVQRTLLLTLDSNDDWLNMATVLPSNGAVSADSSTDKFYRHTGFSAVIADSFSSPLAGGISVVYPSSGNAISTDTTTGKIYVHTGFSSTIADSFSSPSTAPSGVAVHPSGDLLTSDTTTNKIYRHTLLTSAIRDSFSSPSTDPQGISVNQNSGDVISSDDNLNRIYRHSGFSATLLDSFSSPGTNPTSLSVDFSGNVVSADGLSEKIYRHSGFSATILDSFSSPSVDPSGVSSGYDSFTFEFSELGDQTTVVSTSQVISGVWRYSWQGGTPMFAVSKLTPGSNVYVSGINFSAGNRGMFTVVSRGNDYFDVLNSNGSVDSNVTVGVNGYIRSDPAPFSTTNAEGVTMVVNGVVPNFSILKTGYPLVSVRPVDDPFLGQTHYESNFIKAPTAALVNYYKGCLYLGDIRDNRNGTVAPERFKNHFAKSSELLGIISLVNEDVAAGAVEIDITDTKYVIAEGDSLDVYRGGTLIETLTVTGKTELAIQVEATAEDLLGGDEVWLAGTYTGAHPKVFRWPDVIGSGVAVKRFESGPLSGGNNGELTMMENIGDVMMIANDDNVGIWNNYTLRALNGGIGCASRRGYVKCLNRLFFFDERGMYETSGAEPTKVSTPVDAVFRGASRTGIYNGAMGTKGYSVFAAIGDVVIRKDDGSVDRTIPDCAVELDLVKNFWYVHSNVPASQFLRLN